MSWSTEAIRRVESGEAVVGILGLGYVGLPLSMEFAKRLSVVGFDVNAERVANLRAGKSHIGDVPDDAVRASLDRFSPTTDPKALAACDFLIIAVPTPLTQSREPDLGPVESAARTIQEVLRIGQIVILESTTYPGTTQEFLQPILEETGLKAGADFGLAFSPERVDPGNVKFRIGNTPKVVGGVDAASTDAAAALYSTIVEAGVVRVSSAGAAEASKIFENVFRDVNIALVNEFALVCEKLGLDVWEVLSAAATKPFGFMPFQPGPGIGGHCIPLDPHYLSYRARRAGMVPQFVELSAEVNDFMKVHVVNLAGRGLKERGRSLAGATVAVLGLAYKRDVSDTRESPSEKVIDELVRNRAKVRVYDPYAASIRCETGVHSSTASLEDALAGADVAVFMVDHKHFRTIDAGAVEAALAPEATVVDCRNIFARDAFTKARYLAIGKPA